MFFSLSPPADAALGVLKSALGQEDRSMDDESHEGQHLSAHLARHYQAHEMFYSVARSTDPKVADVGESLGLSENKEFWLAKLGSWTEALEVYEEKLLRNPQDFDAILGCMRCLSASGQWSKVLDLAERNWGSLSGMSSLTPDRRQDVSTFTLYITPRDQKKALRMCAEAAWRLGRWEDMEKYSGGLVHHQPFAKSAIISPTAANKHREVSPPGVDFDGAFFSAVLHVHRQQWTQAAKAIDDARKGKTIICRLIIYCSRDVFSRSCSSSSSLYMHSNGFSFHCIDGREL
jgi:tetratricopeptide (TPR) repeat protein